MKTYNETIDRSAFLDDAERRLALAALLDELETLGAEAAAIRPEEDPGDVLDALGRLAAAPLATSPAAHAAIRRVWGRLALASRRHARLLTLYCGERPAARLTPDVAAGRLTLSVLLVAMFAARRLLLPAPAVWWPATMSEDAAAIGRPLPLPAVPPPAADLLAEEGPVSPSP